MKLAVRGEAFASLQLGARLPTARTRKLVICSVADPFDKLRAGSAAFTPLDVDLTERVAKATTTKRTFARPVLRRKVLRNETR